MRNEEAQVVWAAAGYYTGGIDGDIGPKSRAAQSAIERDGGYPAHRMSAKRRFIASVQWCLNKLGFEAGAVDGYMGHNTRNALDGLLYKLATGKAEVVERTPLGMKPKPVSTDVVIPHQRDVKSFYGTPGKTSGTIRNRLETVILPFRLRIDYNLRQSTNKITVHRKVAAPLKAALIAVHDQYGMDRMKALGIDRYAGAYNPRKMRGGSKWSMHAYGCAIDFYAAPNGLRTRCPKALFCGSDYKPFLDIMEAHGWLPAIRLWGADAMHFQVAEV